MLSTWTLRIIFINESLNDFLMNCTLKMDENESVQDVLPFHVDKISVCVCFKNHKLWNKKKFLTKKEPFGVEDVLLIYDKSFPKEIENLIEKYFLPLCCRLSCMYELLYRLHMRERERRRNNKIFNGTLKLSKALQIYLKIVEIVVKSSPINLIRKW